ncbi:MAG: homocysteine S-methyltransferase family protein [Longimicrobiales bacterium]
MGSKYLATLKDRVLVYDGAMGTSIQGYGLSAADFGGPALEGCNDHLVISRPDVVEEIHGSFLEVGCDVIETNTFRSNPITLREYGLHERAEELNRVATALARRVADGFATRDRPRFVAGSIGPSGMLPSTSDPTLGAISYAELADVFRVQARGLIAGGVDVLLIETSQDILEVKAQVTGIRRGLRELDAQVPIQAQVTLDTSERMLLGTDIGAAMVILEALRVDVIGLNCSTGPAHMRQPVRFLCEHSRLPISVIPNAGIPHNEGGTAVYPLTPAELAAAHEEFVTRFGVNVVGGCCGTTPEHMREVVARVAGRAPLARSARRVPLAASAMTAMGLQQDPPPALIGERVNAQGSRAVKRMLLADDYEGILEVARGQVEGGAHHLDVCVAVTERSDEAAQMRTLIKLLAQTVETPLVIDTTEAEVAQAALEQNPGRAIVNSINLENGRERIDRVVPLVVEHGAAVIALTIDEQGMAKTADRKLEVARRIHDICVREYGLDPSDLIFDDLTFTLATGDVEFRRSAIETIEGIRRIKAELPGVLTSLGVSNVSFGLQKHARAVLNSVFLHHCVDAGLDMAIVNPAHVTPYAEIDADARALADDLILDRREDALARFIAAFEDRQVEDEQAVDPTADMEPTEAIHWKILHRKREGIEELVDLAVEGAGAGARAGAGGAGDGSSPSLSPSPSPSPAGSSHEAAVYVLNQVLLPAMKEVGDKFGAGELILPFVLQSAEVMKRAVARVETYLDKVEGQTKGKVVLATVFGDVHDIGKSLVNTILSNNGYTVYDLGKQVPVNTIIEKAIEVDAHAIGLSALLVSTSKQMPLCVQELHARGLRFPVLCGGAAINPSFIRGAAFVDEAKTALYEPGVWYCKDAFEGLAAVETLVDPSRHDEFVSVRHEEIRAGVARRAELQQQARATRPRSTGAGPSRDVAVPEPAFWGVKVHDRIPLLDLYRFIDLNTLYRLHWGAKNAKGEAWERLVKQEFEPRLERYKTEAQAGGWVRVRAAYGFFPAAADGDDVVVLRGSAGGGGGGRGGTAQRELARFPFPRQADRDGLCLADYFRPSGNGRPDVLGLQLVTIGDRLLERSQSLMQSADYSEGYYLHGFGVRLAEAAAEYVHRLMRKELGIPVKRGLRYSWGYPACPDHMQHFTVFDLLPARERLDMELTEAGALVPELSTAALVVHHPEAKYFSVL